jgi:hypothetical protein
VETKELNHAISTKSHDLILKDKNNSELNNNYNRNSSHIFRSKINNEAFKLIGNNLKNTFGKRNKPENIISKKIGLVSIPIKQTKLILFEQNKNMTLLKTHGQSRSNDKRTNKFLFPENKEILLESNFLSKKGLKKLNSKEKKHKHISYSQKNTKENIKNNVINSCKLNRKNNEINPISDYANKTNKGNFPLIINKENNIAKLMNKTTLKDNNKEMTKEININKDSNKKNLKIEKRFNIEMKIKTFSSKEKALYILSQSKILDIRDRIILSRASDKIRKLVQIKDILKSHELFIENKIKDLEQNINIYNKIIENPFSPSKTAIISLNLLTKDDEDDFKNFDENYFNDESEKKYFDIYLELLLILLDEEYKENNNRINNTTELYDKLHKKGFINFKDYLFQIFVLQKFKNELINENKMDKFNELFEHMPNLIKYDGEIKNNKFISFSYFILYEVNFYWKQYRECIEFKNEAEYYIDYLKKKISIINK